MKIQSIADFVAAINDAHDSLGHELWWRGQGDAAWHLCPGIFRGANDPRREKDLIFRFMRKARSRHAALPTADDLWDWLLLMQHYGLPTRLFDWSESPLVALYFAICDVEQSGDAIVFALQPSCLNETVSGYGAIWGKDNAHAREFIEPAMRVDAEPRWPVAAINVSDSILGCLHN